MYSDSLPEWWTQSAVFQCLAGPGRWLLPCLIHAACLGIEVSILRAYGRLPYKERPAAERSAWAVLLLHALTFFLTLSAIDSGVSFYYASGVWALLTVVLSAKAFRRVRTTEPEPDAYARHMRPDFAKLQANRKPERTP